MYQNNFLSSFANQFPQNLDLKNRSWEIGVVSVGLHFNYRVFTLPIKTPVLIVLKKSIFKNEFKSKIKWLTDSYLNLCFDVIADFSFSRTLKERCHCQW